MARHLGVILTDQFFVFKQKTAYEMRISDWSSDVCSSDLRHPSCRVVRAQRPAPDGRQQLSVAGAGAARGRRKRTGRPRPDAAARARRRDRPGLAPAARCLRAVQAQRRRASSEEHTSTPVTNAHLVCRLLLEKKNSKQILNNNNTPIRHI